MIPLLLRGCGKTGTFLALALVAAVTLPGHAAGGQWQADTIPGAEAPVSDPLGIAHEHAASMFLSQVNAAYAHAHGLTGKGVTIAVMDTGIGHQHAEFAASGKLLQGFNVLDGSADVTDRRGHGSHVAGVLGAARNGHGMMGVAYDARILPIKVFPDTGPGSSVYAERGMRYAIGKAAIVNMSFGTPDTYPSQAMRELVDAGVLVVASAGNRGAKNPEWPARFAKEVWAANSIIAVGAVDENNQIATFSNRAGDTAAWFLVAPGTHILSAHPDGQYAILSGTSMATAVVSGAAALLKQAWPYLRAEQIAALLFVTATDLGEPGIDRIYGRGLLNIEKALQPVGTVRTSSWNGRPMAVLDTSVAPSPATSALWQFAAQGGFRIAALDDFGRSFDFDLGRVVVPPVALSVQQVFGSLDQRIELAQRVLTHSHAMAVGSFGLAIGQGAETAQQFGFAAEADLNLFAAAPSLASPYIGLVPNPVHATLGYRARAGITLRAGLLSSRLPDSAKSIPGPVARMPQPTGKTDLAMIELSRTTDRVATLVSLSRMQESDRFLGAQATGAVNFGAASVTSAMQLTSAWLVASGWALAGQVGYGITPGSTLSSSLVAELTETRSNAFSVALIASDRFHDGDRISIALSQPMRAYAGRMVLDVVTSIDEAGQARRERRILSLVPSARELLTEVTYLMRDTGDGSTALSLSWRHNPNHLDNARAEALLAVRHIKSF